MVKFPRQPRRTGEGRDTEMVGITATRLSTPPIIYTGIGFLWFAPKRADCHILSMSLPANQLSTDDDDTILTPSTSVKQTRRHTTGTTTDRQQLEPRRRRGSFTLRFVQRGTTRADCRYPCCSSVRRSLKSRRKNCTNASTNSPTGGTTAQKAVQNGIGPPIIIGANPHVDASVSAFLPTSSKSESSSRRMSPPDGAK